MVQAFGGLYVGAAVALESDTLVPALIDAVKLAVKMSHHGSKNNFTKEFLTLVDAEHYLFSSNADTHHHPDDETVQAVIEESTRKPMLWFNYRSTYSEKREAGSRSADTTYKTRYPTASEEGIAERARDPDTGARVSATSSLLMLGGRQV